MKRWVFVLSFFVAVVAFVLVQAFTPLKFGANAQETKSVGGAEAVLLIEANTGTILHEQNANKKLPIASMTKMMTLKVLFNEIESGKFGEDDEVLISDYAASQEGSQAFLDSGKKYKLADLVRSTIIASANDSAVAIAEYVAGSEQAFAEIMNKTCAQMGMTNSHFANSTGLPAVDHYSSASDMAKLAKEVVLNPIYKKYSKIYLDELEHDSGRKTQLVNTSRSLKNYVGFEGGKTGHTGEAGYCMAAVAKRGDMCLVAVVLGETSAKQRTDDIVWLFDYGFDNFKTKEVVSSAKEIAKIEVENGMNNSIAVYAKKSFVVFMNKTDKFEYKIATEFDKLVAPVEKGQKAGTLKVLLDDNVAFETDLIAGENSPHVGLWRTYKSIVEKF